MSRLRVSVHPHRLHAALIGAVLMLAAVVAHADAAPTSRTATDDGLIAFASYWPVSLGELKTPGPETTVICAVDLAGRTYRLTEPFQRTRQAEPSWSPDGSKFAYATYTGGTGGSGIGVRAVGTRSGSPVVPQPADWPSWSPDGSTIAFQSPPDAGVDSSRRGIWLVGADGSNPRRLTDGRGRAAWSPDSSRIALAGGAAPEAGVRIFRLDGRQERSVLSDVLVTSVDWSPDGWTFVLTTGVEGRLEVVGVDGSARKLLTAVRSQGSAWSPSGGLVAFQTSGTIEIVGGDGAGQRRLYSGILGEGGVDWQPTPRPEMLKGLPPCAIVGSETRHRLTGSRFGDSIWGTDMADRISGLAGNDMILALSGSDRVAAGSGDDTVDAGAGNDVVDGGSGRDILVGGGGDDRLSGGAGRDKIQAGTGNDVVVVRDDSRDAVVCGLGRDEVIADAADWVARDCERVRSSR